MSGCSLRPFRAARGGPDRSGGLHIEGGDADQVVDSGVDLEPGSVAFSAQRYTHESWKYSGNFGSVRIDPYTDSGQQQAANAAVLSFYRGSGDKRTLAELPLACGTASGAGFDENSQRDAATAELAAAGLAGGPCDG